LEASKCYRGATSIEPRVSRETESNQSFLAPADPQDSVTAIKEISGTIERLSEISSAIAAAVEQQGAATQEISPPRAEGVAGHPAGVAQHHRCATWRQRDRIGLIASAFGYALTVGREQTSQDRSVQVPRFGPRRLKRRRRNAGWLVVHPWFTFILRVFPRSDQALSVFSALRQAADLRSCLQFG